MPSWSSAARCSHAPLQLKAMEGVAHSAWGCLQGRKELEGKRVTVEPRLVGNLLTNPLVSIRNMPKMLHRGDKSQLHGETFHKEHRNGHFMCPLSLQTLLSILLHPSTQAFVLSMAHSQSLWGCLEACWSEYFQDVPRSRQTQVSLDF